MSFFVICAACLLIVKGVAFVAAHGHVFARLFDAIGPHFVKLSVGVFALA